MVEGISTPPTAHRTPPSCPPDIRPEFSTMYGIETSSIHWLCSAKCCQREVQSLARSSTLKMGAKQNSRSIGIPYRHTLKSLVNVGIKIKADHFHAIWRFEDTIPSTQARAILDSHEQAC